MPDIEKAFQAVALCITSNIIRQQYPAVSRVPAKSTDIRKICRFFRATMLIIPITYVRTYALLRLRSTSYVERLSQTCLLILSPHFGLSDFSDLSRHSCNCHVGYWPTRLTLANELLITRNPVKLDLHVLQSDRSVAGTINTSG